MKAYIRTTHNFNNITREWEYRREFENFPEIVLRIPESIDYISQTDWMSKVEILQEHEEDYQQCLKDGVERKRTAIEDLDYDLSQMEKAGFIKSRGEED
jgi:hypothetical protein